MRARGGISLYLFQLKAWGGILFSILLMRVRGGILFYLLTLIEGSRWHFVFVYFNRGLEEVFRYIYFNWRLEVAFVSFFNRGFEAVFCSIYLQASRWHFVFVYFNRGLEEVFRYIYFNWSLEMTFCFCIFSSRTPKRYFVIFILIEGLRWHLFLSLIDGSRRYSVLIHPGSGGRRVNSREQVWTKKAVHIGEQLILQYHAKTQVYFQFGKLFIYFRPKAKDFLGFQKKKSEGKK